MRLRKPAPVSLLGICAAILLLAGCGSSSSGPAATTTTYATTSNKGDYSEWSLDGDTLTTTWQEINSTGEVAVIYDITADCGPEAASGIRACTITSASCTDGVETCTTTPAGDIDVMAVPGVALFATTPATATSAEQLHVGFAKDSAACGADVAGDYTFIRTALSIDENFGVFRSDSDFLSVLHADFGFDTPDMNTTQTLAYRSSSESELFSDLGCADGVRIRGAGGETIRAMLTQSGLLMLDLPGGQGGYIAFDTANAASIDDFANASWGGISFPDDAAPEALSATSAATSSGRVTFTIGFGGGSFNPRVMDLGTADTESGPAYPDFTSTTDPSPYGTTVLHTSYPSIDDIPGLFKLDGSTDEGRVIIAAVKFNGKVVAVGMVYNYRTTSDPDLSVPGGSTNFAAPGLYNTGNFLLFQR